MSFNILFELLSLNSVHISNQNKNFLLDRLNVQAVKKDSIFKTSSIN